jgi:ATP synthase I chain
MMSDELYRRAPQRIERTVVILGVISAVAALALASWRDGLGILIGAAASWLNFHWLQTSIVGLTNRMAANPQATGSAGLLALRFLLRYAVVGAVVYATLKGSVASGLGVCAGLLLIVPALMFEAIYEFYLGRQRNTPVS